MTLNSCFYSQCCLISFVIIWLFILGYRYSILFFIWTRAPKTVKIERQKLKHNEFHFIYFKRFRFNNIIYVFKGHVDLWASFHEVFNQFKLIYINSHCLRIINKLNSREFVLAGHFLFHSVLFQLIDTVWTRSEREI